MTPAPIATIIPTDLLLVFSYVDPKTLFRVLLTSKENWKLPQSCLALDEYFRHHFFEFVHQNFKWRHEQFNSSEVVCIRAVNQHDTSLSYYGPTGDLTSKYEFVVDIPTTGVQNVVIEGQATRVWLLWRDMYNEARQRTLMLRYLHKGHDVYFDVGDERWVRIKDMALSEAVCQTAATMPDRFDNISYTTDNVCEVTAEWLPCIERLNTLVDVALYRRTDKHGHVIRGDQRPTDDKRFGPIAGAPTEDELCKLWYMGAADKLQVVAPNQSKLVQTGKLLWQQEHRGIGFTSDNLFGAFRKINFAQTFGSAERFPLVGRLPLLKQGRLSRQGIGLIGARFMQNTATAGFLLPFNNLAKLCITTIKVCDNSLKGFKGDVEWASNLHKDLGPPPRPISPQIKIEGKGKTEVSFREHAILTVTENINQPSSGRIILSTCVYDSTADLATNWLLYKINKIRLAVSGILEFHPYADGTVWEMSDCNILPVFSETEHSLDNGKCQPKPVYGNCNNVYIGPEAVLVVRYNLRGLEKVAKQLRNGNIAGFNIIPNEKIFS